MSNCIIIATFILLLTVVHQGIVNTVFLVVVSLQNTFLRIIQQKIEFILGLSTPAIGFSAVLTHNAYLGNNQAIIYGNVLTNVGNGYNKWSGHFTVPKKGLYVFSCTVRANTNDGITVGIVHNGRQVLRIASSVYSPETASGKVVLALKKGDNVWVRRLGQDKI